MPVVCPSQPYSLLRHICWGRLLHHDVQETLIAMVTPYALYLDVAGHPSDQPILAAGGFLATESQWLAFEPVWKEALKDNGLPETFHMTDFEAKYKNNPHHWDILKNLIDVISQHTLASFSNTVSMEGYRRINNKYPFEEVFGRPYGIAASSAARLVHHWQISTGHKGPLLFFVEQGTFHHGDMIECFLRDGLPAPIPVPKELPAAQAADLYAWERAWYNNTSIRRPSMEYIKTKMPDGVRGVDGKWERRSIEQSLKKLNIPLRKDFPPDHKFFFHSLPKRERKRTIF
jgi:hypothetical protein